MSATKIAVTKNVADQLEAIRDSGEINMFDRRGVQVIANRRDFYDLVIWIEDAGSRIYGEAIIGGFEIAPEDAL